MAEKRKGDLKHEKFIFAFDSFWPTPPSGQEKGRGAGSAVVVHAAGADFVNLDAVCAGPGKAVGSSFVIHFMLIVLAKQSVVKTRFTRL